MRFSAAGLALLFLLAVPLAAQTTVAGPGTVVYPAATGISPGAFPKEGPGGGFSPLAAIGIAAFAGRGERRLVVAETRALGNRQYLVVAAYDDKRYLLGVCPGRIEMLAPLDSAAPPPLP